MWIQLIILYGYFFISDKENIMKEVNFNGESYMWGVREFYMLFLGFLLNNFFKLVKIYL